MHFAQPGWLWLMILMPLPWLLERARPRIAWPSLDGFPPEKRFGWVWLRRLPALLCGWSIAALAVAARPSANRRRQHQNCWRRGRDPRRSRPELEHEYP